MNPLALIDKYRLIIGAVFILLAVSTIGLIAWRVHVWHEAYKQLETVKEELAKESKLHKQFESAYITLSVKVVEQNAAIETWQARAKTASTKAAEAIKKSKAMAEHRQGEISRLKASIKAGGASCAEAVKEIRESLP